MKFGATLIAAIVAAMVATGGCNRDGGKPAASVTPPMTPIAATMPAPAPTVTPAEPVHDLSIDERMGGHTLARHVGRSEADLRERLRREPQISAASTYTDRTTAERVIAAALLSSSRKVEEWEGRRGRRPNLVLNYNDRRGPPLGTSLARGRQHTVTSHRALVVLRWDDRADRFYVLTSYPEGD